MIKVALVMPIMNQAESAKESFNSFKDTQGEVKIPAIIVDNGSNPPVKEWLSLDPNDRLIRNDQNIGVLPALNEAYAFFGSNFDYLFYTHSDVVMYEQNWSDKLVKILEQLPDCGVAGFYGAKGIGTADIYTNPYIMQQLIRVENVSGCHRMNAAVHGFRDLRGGDFEEVAVMDGFSLIVKTELIKKVGGFDKRYPVHHMYDNDICVESLDKGYKNYVIRMDAFHHGGRTDVGENWAEAFGKTKQQVHQEAHPVFYEKWHPAHVTAGNHKVCLPIRVL